MALETATYISGLIATNPVATDGLAQADDHMRLIKSTILASFPAITGAVDATHSELNTVADGNTSATATTLVDTDQIPVNDSGTMVQVALTDFKTYMNTSGNILTINGLTYPTADGSAGDLLTTDGAGTLSFTAANLSTFVSGMIMPFAGAAAPANWLTCHGQAVSRTTYAALFAALGVVYGAGDGSTTFNLPDLRGRTVAGKDDMGATSANRLTNQTGGLDGDVLGATGGAETHTLTTAEMPAHTHSVPQGGQGASNYAGGGGSSSFSVPQTTGSTGNGDAHNNIQPTIILNYIIKT